MKYREIPRTDLRVSLIGLGTMTWGEQNTEAEGHEQMDYALSRGVNLFDTAEMYPVPPRAETCHETERIIGTWFASRGTRDEVVLATKAVGPGPHVTHVREGVRHNRAHLTAALEGSLRRLRTDRIDLYQLHWPDRPVPLFGKRDYEPPAPGAETVPIEETLAVLADFVASGKVRYIGLSNETPWGTMRFLELARDGALPRVVTIQNSYNLLNRSFDGGLSEICHEEDVRLLPYSPLAFGRLSGKYRGGRWPEGARLTIWERFARYSGPNSDAAVEEYARVAEEAGLDFAQMSLAWVNSRPHVASNLIGATTMEQLKSNIDSVDLELSESVLAAIEEVHRRWPNPCP
jgi:aryl-alcohol dehydrogenase-like predicted oxidoreductase